MFHKTSSHSLPSVLSCLALITAATLTGCNAPASSTDASINAADVIAEAPEIATEDNPVAAAPEPPPVVDIPAQENLVDETSILPSTIVSEQGLGVAQLGMTLRELKQALPDLEFSAQSPFIVDFDAIAVRNEDETLFYILHLAGSPLGDGDRIQGLFTSHPIFKTTEDVGVGTPLSSAEVPYGKAVLSYNTGNESREYVRFEDHPATNISFGTQKSVVSPNGGDLALAGIYPTPTPQYNETEVYQADAVIEAILIVCLSATCSQ